MRSNLKNGKLVEPPTLPAAACRRQQLEHEAQRIEAQLTDQARVKKYPAYKDYAEWRASAQRALALFRSEERQLAEWIARQVGGSDFDLLCEAHELLQTLRDEDVDFDCNESLLIARVAERVRAENYANERIKKEKRA